MYSLFLSKKRGDLPEFPTTAAVKTFLEQPFRFLVFLFPGYSSDKSTINIFCNKIFESSNNHHFFVMFPGMTTITPQMEALYWSSLHGRFKLQGPCKKHVDHSKMMFFFDAPSQYSVFSNADFSSLNTIKNIGLKPRAVLIGGSNQSFTTYLGKSSHPMADKGETDIMLFDENDIFADDSFNAYCQTIKKQIGEENRNRLVAFKEMKNGGNSFSGLVYDILSSVLR